MNALDDASLHAAWTSGDRHAGEVLFERHFDEIFRFFRAKVSGDINDLVQRTFLGCIEAKDRFRGASTFRVYLYGIAKHELYRHYRSKRTSGTDDVGVSSLEDLAPSPSSQARRLDQNEALHAALRSLPLDMQIALELHYWEELAGSDVAYVLGIPEGTVRSRLRRGLDALREVLLAREGQSASADGLADLLASCRRSAE